MAAQTPVLPDGALAYPVTVGTLTVAGLQPQAGNCLITGWSFRETTGAATAVVELFDGNDANGTLIASIALAANESTRDVMSRYGIWCRVGVFVNVTVGTVKGSLWLVDL